MKKLFITALVALAIGTTAFAGPKSISAKVTNHFTNTITKVQNVSWKTDAHFDKVSFVINNEKVDAFYSMQGELIGTNNAIAFNMLPKSAI